MIHLANNYYLDADSYSFMITERHINENGDHIGEEYFTPIAYYTTLKAVILATGDLLARDGIRYHWNKINVSRSFNELIEAVDLVTSPQFIKSFFALKKENS